MMTQRHVHCVFIVFVVALTGCNGQLGGTQHPLYDAGVVGDGMIAADLGVSDAGQATHDAAVDAGAASDASAMEDAAMLVDANTSSDAATLNDAGTMTTDAATPTDASAPLDASMPIDAGVDSSVVTDSGADAEAAMDSALADAGVHPDAGTSMDAAISILDSATPVDAYVDPCAPSVIRSRNLGLQTSAEELAIWRTRMASGPYLHANDVSAGSPGAGDWILEWANAYAADAGVTPSINPDAGVKNFWQGYGQCQINTWTDAGLTQSQICANAVDAGLDYSYSSSSATCGHNEPWDRNLYLLQTAFAALVTNTPRYAQAAHDGVMAEMAPAITAGDPAACFPDATSTPSQEYGSVAASAMTRVVRAYDFTRNISGLYSPTEKQQIHDALLRAATWYLTAVDRGPKNCLSYGARPTGSSALPYNLDAGVISTSNPTCSGVDVCGPARSLGTSSGNYSCYTHLNSAGVPDRTIPVLATAYNNRKAMKVEFAALAAILMRDEELRGAVVANGFDAQDIIDGTKRYVEEWLRFSVFPDGSQGEYERNGDYGIPQQGFVYGLLNIDTAMVIADALARRGDVELLTFETCQGFQGTECIASGDTPKSLRNLAQAYLEQMDHTRRYYFARRDDDGFLIDPLDEITVNAAGSDAGVDAAVDGGTPVVITHAAMATQWLEDTAFAQLNHVWRDNYVMTSYLRQRMGSYSYAGRLVGFSGIGGETYPGAPHGGTSTNFMGAKATFPSLLFMFGNTDCTALPVYECAQQLVPDEGACPGL